MLENQKIRPAQVIGPLGESLTLDSLPRAEHHPLGRAAQGRSGRRRGRRAADVDEACQRYTLSLEEFTSWQRAVDRFGHARAARDADQALSRSIRASAALLGAICGQYRVEREGSAGDGRALFRFAAVAD